MTDELESPMVIEYIGEARTLAGLAKALDEVILGQRVVYSLLDTSDERPTLQSGFCAVTDPVTVFDVGLGNYRGLHIKVLNGGSITLFDAPIIDERKEAHFARVQIDGKHVAVSTPHMFGEVGLHWRHYAITAHRPIDT